MASITGRRMPKRCAGPTSPSRPSRSPHRTTLSLPIQRLQAMNEVHDEVHCVTCNFVVYYCSPPYTVRRSLAGRPRKTSAILCQRRVVNTILLL